jgi:hypothetical protein
MKQVAYIQNPMCFASLNLSGTFRTQNAVPVQNFTSPPMNEKYNIMMFSLIGQIGVISGSFGSLRFVERSASK